MLTNNHQKTARTIHNADDEGSPDFSLDQTIDSFPDFREATEEVPPIRINPQVVVWDWSKSWNPANGGPIKYIDVNCLERVANVMHHFRYNGSDIPRDFTNFDDEMREWLLQFVLNRHPFGLLYGSVFLHSPQEFHFKKRSFSSKFQPLQQLGDDEIPKFSNTLFISWNVLTDLFEGTKISGLFSNVRNKNGDYIYRILRIQKKRRDQSMDRRLRRSTVSDHFHQQNDQRFVERHLPIGDEEEHDSIGQRTKRRRTTNDIFTKEEN
jgi:hypothetical protein